MNCQLCGFPRIPGITSCVNCGDMDEDAEELLGRLADEGASGKVEDAPLDVPDAAQVERWKAENTESRRLVRRLTEARALEYAGDSGTACGIYEALLREGCCYPAPYRRLTIIYHKMKDRVAEERVVRAALGHLSAGTNGWFILRLAKLLGARR